MSSWTIEHSDEYPHWSVYEFGIYPRSSVLAGQDMKSFRESYPTLEEAQAAHPEAIVGYRDPMNYFDHLSDEEGVG